ncbi:transcription repressor NadR [Metabacillus idriensis]|uniref:HTH domain-containing protein n=1 Tax=Metabacillus idriensis TaxID=324768 RepID=A0A6I2MEW1_9BACI|nr:transcription repressor NadR [Metabacillus idriensis]MCM3596378.1 transcription repressor NadR [Metabacillus idriensis]MRX56928.1 HTH domain-containing protein [Metabacillus idriensis]OHR71873.1 transcriptional regulator [Bacillus sp. HMSC76G11]
MSEGKIPGTKRRELILNWLKETKVPMKGSDMAKKTNVSRQVIVQDISLLKAQNEPILATSQGYVYMKQENDELPAYKRIIASSHKPEATGEELNIIVDYGVTVKDVIIEHPVYGELTASIMVSNRKEVRDFIEKIEETKAAYLSQLTEGLHLHTLVADREEKLDEVCAALKTAGFLVNEED